MENSFDLNDFAVGTHSIVIEDSAPAGEELVITIQVFQESDDDGIPYKEFYIDGNWEQLSGESERDGHISYHDSTPFEEEIEDFLNDRDIDVKNWLEDAGFGWQSFTFYHPNGGETYHRFVRPDDVEAIGEIIQKGAKYSLGDEQEIINIAHGDRVAFSQSGMDATDWFDLRKDDVFPKTHDAEVYIKEQDRKLSYQRPATDNWEWLEELYVSTLESAEDDNV